MTDWTGGYVADIGYTYGYYSELNPQYVKLAFLNKGLAFPDIGTACELGFGQGMSANIHAAASTVQWYGTDFNPTQANFAQELADVAGAGAKLYDEAFEEFANRSDLPDFDYIGLHGIWTWISDTNRQVIVDFVRKKLKVGGVLYISYNTLPGWAAFAPMRHLLSQHAEVLNSAGRGTVNRVDDAVKFAQELLAVNPIYSLANPQVSERLKKLKDMNRHYLAHEYFNMHWHPMHFSTMAGLLENAKIQYACSAHYLDHVDVLNLTADQQAFLSNISNPMFRETVRDYMVNQQFRRDYWVKGARTLNPIDRIDALRAQRVVLVTNPADVSLKVNGALGEASMSEAVYAPILGLLADHKPKTLGQIEAGLRDKGITLAQIIQAAIILCGGRQIALAQEDNVISRVRKQSDRLNMHLCLKARGSSDISYLASPVIGGAIPINRFEQLFLLSINQGRKSPADLAQYVWQMIAMQGQTLMKNGQSLDGPEANIAELTSQAEQFLTKRLPVLKSLQIA